MDEQLTALLLGTTTAYFTDAARAGSRTALCWDATGHPLVLAAPGARTSIALRFSVAVGTIVIAGRCGAISADSAGARRFARSFDACTAPTRLAVLHCSLLCRGTREPIDPVGPLAEALFPAAVEDRIVEHMNVDHGNALYDYCRHAGVACTSAVPVMVGLDQFGFFLRAEAGLARIAFRRRCTTGRAVREALIALAGEARRPS